MTNNKAFPNRFYFDKQFGLFVGTLTDNRPHKHYAQQICVSVESPMTLKLANETEQSGNAFFINANTTHLLISDDPQLTLLINPLSTIGHYLRLWQSNHHEDIVFKNELLNNLTQLLKAYIHCELHFENIANKVGEVLEQYKCSCETDYHLYDDRIMKAMTYLDTHFDEVISLEEVATYCNLSPSRFQHLFKETTQLNFRGYQRWNKLIKSLPYLSDNSITETAHKLGFTDSSHYTRTFIATFGVTPKFITQQD